MQGPVSSQGLLQSLDAQPEQLALRPKEFFRAHGIEVLTEAQVQTMLGNRPGEGFMGTVKGVRPLEVWVCSALPAPLPRHQGCSRPGGVMGPSVRGHGPSAQGWDLGALGGL